MVALAKSGKKKGRVIIYVYYACENIGIRENSAARNDINDNKNQVIFIYNVNNN